MPAARRSARACLDPGVRRVVALSGVTCAPSALGAPRLRATRGGRHWVKGTPRGPAAFGVSFRGFGGRAFRPVLVSARRGFWNATPAARRRAARGTPQRVRRAARCGCAFVRARPSSGDIAAFRWDVQAQRQRACPSRPHARRLGGWWGASRSDRQAAGVPVAQGRRARWAQPRGTAVGAAKATLRNLPARRGRGAPNDARRDGRGGRHPAARSGAGDGLLSELDRTPIERESLAYGSTCWSFTARTTACPAP